jgi:uncharacterized membrane protein
MKVLVLMLLTFPTLLNAHGGKTHSKNEVEPIKRSDALVEVYKSINADYEAKIEPIFQAKCFDCHSANSKYPWYYQIPGVNLVINSHIKEARGHIDMTEGFPFKGHLSPIEDLKELKLTIERGAMPPWYYKPFHKNSEIKPQEKMTILNWINESLVKLEEKK